MYCIHDTISHINDLQYSCLVSIIHNFMSDIYMVEQNTTHYEKTSVLIICNIYIWYLQKAKVNSSMPRSLPVENLLPQNVGVNYNYFQ